MCYLYIVQMHEVAWPIQKEISDVMECRALSRSGVWKIGIICLWALASARFHKFLYPESYLILCRRRHYPYFTDKFSKLEKNEVMSPQSHMWLVSESSPLNSKAWALPLLWCYSLPWTRSPRCIGSSTQSVKALLFLWILMSVWLLYS